MTILVMRFNTFKATNQLGLFTSKEIKQFNKAVGLTLQAVSTKIHQRAAADILRAGKFSARWPAALHETVQKLSEGNWSMRIGFSHAIPYAHVHEFGATIRGRPLLWIPLPWNPIKVRARDYPGKLFRVERLGKNPLLFSSADKEAKYVGVASVTLRQRFHIRTITSNVVRAGLAKLFAGYVQGVKL